MATVARPPIHSTRFSPQGREAFAPRGTAAAAPLEPRIEARFSFGEPRIEARFSFGEQLVHQDPVSYYLITCLGPNQPTLKHAIMLTVKPTDKSNDNYIASFSDASIFASGDTEKEAAENLCDIISCQFRVLSQHAQDKLGPNPLMQLSALRRYLQE